MSGDPEQDYFADGVTEDIITELSRFHVVVRDRPQSAASPTRARPLMFARSARDLGVRYVLEGSIRKAGQPDSRYRPAHRCRHRKPYLGGSLRPGAGRHLCGAGGTDAEYCADDRATHLRDREWRKHDVAGLRISAPTRSRFVPTLKPGNRGSSPIACCERRQLGRRGRRWRSTPQARSP